MQRVPSTQSTRSIPQTKSSEIKTSSNVVSDDRTSTKSKKGDDTKKPADDTDHTTVSTSFCGCKKDKCDAFFDKLLCYLEKQSDIIAKCCTQSQKHKRDSLRDLTCSRTIKSKDSCKDDRPKDPCKDDRPKDPYKDDRPKDLCKYDRHKDECEDNRLNRSTSSQEMKPIRPSPCKDDPEPNFHRRASTEMQRSLKGKAKSKDGYEDFPNEESKHSRYKSQLELRGNRALKVGGKPCNIYVEVCSCQKEMQRSLKGKAKNKDGYEDFPNEDSSESKQSRYKSQLELGGNRALKVGGKPCNIYVEVCSCQKEGKRAHQSAPKDPKDERLAPKAIEADSEQYRVEQRSVTAPQRLPGGKFNEYGVDCHGCEKKVSYFFNLAEEICQGYLGQYQELDPNRARFNQSGYRRPSREDFGNQVPSSPYQTEPWNEGSDMKLEKQSSREYNSNNGPQVRPIAIEIECGGTKEEFLIDPCQCVEISDSSYGRGKPAPVPARVERQGPKRSCLEIFENRYGKTLRDLHGKLSLDQKQNPPSGYPPQSHPPAGYPNPYGDAAPQQPPTQQPPPQQPPPADPEQKEETRPPPQQSKQSQTSDDSSSEWKKPKTKGKRKKKKKGSKESRK